jgi:hypothetical protein
VAGADDGVAADRAGSLVEDEVAADGEADLGAIAAGAGGVKAEECDALAVIESVPLHRSLPVHGSAG